MLDGELLYSVPKAFELETGVRISPATGHRFRHRDGLETVRLGGRRMTSREAVRRCIDRRTQAAEGAFHSPAAPRTNRQHEAAINAADRELAALGG
jgi:hypothetical protein